MNLYIFLNYLSMNLIGSNFKPFSEWFKLHTTPWVQLSATTSLLELTCDAVVRLDVAMRLEDHSPKLAAMLLRTGTSLKGGKAVVFSAHILRGKDRNSGMHVSVFMYSPVF